MKIKINDKEIELTPEQVKILGEEVKKEKKGLWKPEFEEKYYCIDIDGDVDEDCWVGNVTYDQKRYSIGNVFKTEEEAKAHVQKLKAIQRVKEYIAENCRVVDDAEDYESQNWRVSYDTTERRFIAECDGIWISYSPIPYLKTKTDAFRVSEDCEADLKIIWGIK